jgi:hypothetical protein
MACAVPTTLNTLKTVEWMWQSNPDPWSKTEPAKWSHYSDVENLLIERAFSNKEPRAILDDYYIDFSDNWQIFNNDGNKQRPVKRVMRKREDKHLREERFMDQRCAGQGISMPRGPRPVTYVVPRPPVPVYQSF